MQQPKCSINCSVKPSVVSTSAKGDEILFVLDVILFRVVQRAVVLDVVSHATVFGFGRAIGREQLLCRIQKCGLK